jgi:hypothetical protein
MLMFNVDLGRELIWLEDRSFAAWGCGVCNWIFHRPGLEGPAKPPEVTEAFNKHECANFPRHVALRNGSQNRAARESAAMSKAA